jgi:hypothetical protein
MEKIGLVMHLAEDDAIYLETALHGDEIIYEA